jgi:hypothetical protein
MRTRVIRLVLLALFLAPDVTSGQGAPGISVPAGFRVEKLLELNQCGDPQKIGFLPSGDLVVASMMRRIYQVDAATGEVSVRARFTTTLDPGSFDILVSPAGIIYFSGTVGIYRLDGDQAVRVTPEGWRPTYIARDAAGNLYAAAEGPGGFTGVAKFRDSNGDGQFELAQPLIPGRAHGLVFKDGFLYVAYQGRGSIEKYDAAGNWAALVATSLNWPVDLASDNSGNFYTTVYEGQVPDDYVWFDVRSVVKIRADGTTARAVEGIKGEGFTIAVGPGDVLYLSEFDRGVVSKVVEGKKVDVTRDTGLNMVSEPAFDLFNRPYFSSFRFARLYRLDPEAGTTEAVTPALGYATQTIAVNRGGKLFLHSTWWNVDGEEFPTLFRFDPVAATLDRQLLVPWGRTLRFDAFGRLVAVQSTVAGTTPDDGNTTLGLFETTTGQLIPYVAGNDMMRFLFDEQQNLFARHRRWEGIIKVAVPRDATTPPFSVSGAPLFYDLRSKNSEIRYFDLNARGQMLIPLVDTGEIVLGETDGRWREFAGGFDWPGYARFDRNGVLYVVTLDGVYRIIGRDFMIPALGRGLRELQAAIANGVQDRGLVASLTRDLANVVASLERGNVRAAANLIGAFVSHVNAQKGRKIDAESAGMLVGIVQSIRAGFALL